MSRSKSFFPADLLEEMIQYYSLIDSLERNIFFSSEFNSSGQYSMKYFFREAKLSFLRFILVSPSIDPIDDLLMFIKIQELKKNLH